MSRIKSNLSHGCGAFKVPHDTEGAAVRCQEPCAESPTVTPSGVDFRAALRKAIALLLERDIHLLSVDVNERAITHRLACHLQHFVKGYDIDCEYNRNQNMIKVLRSHGFTDRCAVPDIIVHRRGTDENRLVIEAKKAKEPERDKEQDRQKLRALVDDLGYPLAAFLVIRTGEDDPGIDTPEWIERESTVTDLREC
jgi:hypothetical protein